MIIDHINNESISFFCLIFEMKLLLNIDDQSNIMWLE